MTDLTLGIETKTTHHIDWLTYSWARDKGHCGLDELCEQVYGKKLDMGSNNDTDYSVNIKREIMADYDTDNLIDIIKSGFFEEYQLHLVMTDLCNNGYIEEGSYVVTMSW